jgi:putative salt-induced outer membrane protein
MTSNAFKLTFLALACAASTVSLAQDKTDGLWRGNGGAAVSLTSGNTSTSSLLLITDMARATASDKVSLLGSISYAKNKSGGLNQTTSNKWGAAGQYDYNLSPVMYGFGRLGLESDKLVDLSLRSSITGGLGYKIIKSETTNFDVLGGVAYTTDKYSLAKSIGGKTDTSFSRSSIYFGELSSHKLSPTVSY